MLDIMRRNAQSIVIVFILSILILAFVIEFGPQSRGCRGDASERERSSHSLMTVLGYSVGELEFELWRLHASSEPDFARCVMGPESGALGETGGSGSDNIVAVHFRNAFLIREALVREAERFGLAVDDEEVKKALSHGRLFVFDHGYWFEPGEGHVHFCGGVLPLQIGVGREGKIDPQALRAVLQQRYQMSIDDFYAFQRRNLLALKMQQILAGGVGVSPSEVEAEIRADVEEATLMVWTVSPAASTDEEISALQARFDETLAAIPDSDVEVWLAQEKNARKVDAKIAAIPSAGMAGVDPDPAAGRRDVARSLIAVDRMTENLRQTARAARLALSRPEAPPDTPPPAPPGVTVFSQPVTVRTFATPDRLPHVLTGLDDPVNRILTLTEQAPVLDEDIERDAGVASVRDPAGEVYPLREVALVRRLPPWTTGESVDAAVAEQAGARAVDARDAKQARILEAWYGAELYAAKASDQIDDEALMRYVEESAQQRTQPQEE